MNSSDDEIHPDDEFYRKVRRGETSATLSRTANQKGKQRADGSNTDPYKSSLINEGAGGIHDKDQMDLDIEHDNTRTSQKPTRSYSPPKEDTVIYLPDDEPYDMRDDYERRNPPARNVETRYTSRANEPPRNWLSVRGSYARGRETRGWIPQVRHPGNLVPNYNMDASKIRLPSVPPRIIDQDPPFHRGNHPGPSRQPPRGSAFLRVGNLVPTPQEMRASQRRDGLAQSRYPTPSFPSSNRHPRSIGIHRKKWIGYNTSHPLLPSRRDLDPQMIYVDGEYIMAPRKIDVGRDVHLVATRTLRYHVPVNRDAKSGAGSSRYIQNRAYRDEPEELQERILGEIDLRVIHDREDEYSESSTDEEEMVGAEERQSVSPEPVMAEEWEERPPPTPGPLSYEPLGGQEPVIPEHDEDSQDGLQVPESDSDIERSPTPENTHDNLFDTSPPPPPILSRLKECGALSGVPVPFLRRNLVKSFEAYFRQDLKKKGRLAPKIARYTSRILPIVYWEYRYRPSEQRQCTWQVTQKGWLCQLCSSFPPFSNGKAFIFHLRRDHSDVQVSCKKLAVRVWELLVLFPSSHPDSSPVMNQTIDTPQLGIEPPKEPIEAKDHPYIPERAVKGQRVGGVRVFDIAIQEMPMPLRGLEAALLRCREEWLCMATICSDTDKAMAILWGRWAAQYRREFLANPVKSIENFITKYCLLIQRVTEHKNEGKKGYLVFLRWLLTLKVHGHITQQQTAFLCTRYKELLAQSQSFQE